VSDDEIAVYVCSNAPLYEHFGHLIVRDQDCPYCGKPLASHEAISGGGADTEGTEEGTEG
jgi:hypothetical protein